MNANTKIKPPNWDIHRNDGIVESSYHEIGEKFSDSHSDTEISEEVSLAIYEDYYPTDADVVKLKIGSLTTGMNYDGNIDKIRIKLEGKLNAGYTDNVNIIGIQFSDEEQHYDHRHEGTRSISQSINEIRATLRMINDPSFDKIKDAHSRGGIFDYLYHYLSTEKKN